MTNRKMGAGPRRIGVDESERIATAAIVHIAANDELLSRFVSVTGIDPAEIRSLVGDRAFLAGVLDFLMGHEPDALAFAEEAQIAPDDVGMARIVLSGGNDPDAWTSI